MPSHHHRLTGIYPWIELISRLSTTMSPPEKHMRPRGDLLSWLPPFLVEEEAAGDMLAWEETVQFLAGVIHGCVCGITASTVPEEDH